MGRGNSRKECHHHCWHLSQRFDAHRTTQSSGRALRRTRRCPPHTESITRWGIRSARMKTGTPVRLDKRTIHFEDTERQDGEADFHQFSYMAPHRILKQLPCWTCYTNKSVHDILKADLDNSPLFNGQIQSTGPRPAPAVHRTGRRRHQRDVSQRLLILHADGDTAARASADSSTARGEGLPPRLCHRI